MEKKPVVATAVGGIPARVIHKHAVLPSHSVEAAACRIRYLLSNPALAKKLDEQEHEHVRENSLIASNVKRYLTLFLHSRKARPVSTVIQDKQYGCGFRGGVSVEVEERSMTIGGVAERSARVSPELPKGSQVLIVGEHANAQEVVAKLGEAGIGSQTAKSMTEACECVRSGHFQAILSKPLMSDGSWRRLIDVAHHYDLGFEVVLVTSDLDHAGWAEALNDGAFEVLATLNNELGATEVTKRALWAAYLKGAGPKAASPQKAA